ncbi:MAG TPA: hypothetical protein VGH28_14650 [Polyangiaceae bacterium]
MTVVSAALAMSVIGGSADATPSCALDGTWSVTRPGGRTMFTTKLIAATHAVTVDRTGGGLPNAHIEGTYTYDSASGRITMMNKSVSTQDMAFFACLNVPGTYTVSFSDCTHLTLGLVSDECMPRRQSANQTTLTKQ